MEPSQNQSYDITPLPSVSDQLPEYKPLQDLNPSPPGSTLHPKLIPSIIIGLVLVILTSVSIYAFQKIQQNNINEESIATPTSNDSTDQTNSQGFTEETLPTLTPTPPPTATPTNKPLPTPTLKPTNTTAPSPTPSYTPTPSPTPKPDIYCDAVANPANGPVPLEVKLHYSATYNKPISADNYITEVQWDLDGNGTWDTDTNVNNGQWTHIYHQKGDYNVKLRLKLKDGREMNCNNTIHAE